MNSDIESNLGSFFVFQTTGEFVSAMVSAAIVIAALGSLIYLVYGGVTWTTAGDDKTKVEQAQKSMTNAVIGLGVTVAAFAIWSLAKGFFGLGEVLVSP